MPIYESLCTSCGRGSEIMQRMSDPPATECPECHAQALIKQISAVGFRLKGGGWYETDFKSGAKKNVSGESKAPEASTSSSTPSAGGGCAGKCACH